MKGFLKSQKALAIKEYIDKFNYIKIKSFNKNIIKRKVSELVKIFAVQLINNTIIRKMDKRLKKCLTKEEIRWLINICKHILSIRMQGNAN